jgi:hypothetical protein
MGGMKPALVLEEIPDPHPEAHRYPNAYLPVVPNGRRCAVTGLTHGHLYRLLRSGPAARHIRIVSLRERGAARGKLLFHVGDMLRWLDAKAAEQAQKCKAKLY